MAARIAIAALGLALLTGCVTFSAAETWTDYVGAQQTGDDMQCLASAEADGARIDGDLPAEHERIFYVSTRLPDCRDAARIDYVRQRTDRVRYGYLAKHIGDGEDGDRALTALMPEEAWWQKLEAELQARGTGRVFLYVHGYNESFATAAETAAKLSACCAHEMPVILFSWPSMDRFWLYGTDLTNREWTGIYLTRFLDNLAARQAVGSIAVLAHSLGNQIVFASLRELEEAAPESAAKVKTIVNASADYDRQMFERTVGEELLDRGHVDAGRRIVVYTSAIDRANGWFGARVRGYDRLGATRCADPSHKRLMEAQYTGAKAGGTAARCYPFYEDRLTGGKRLPRTSADEPALTVIDSSKVSASFFGHSDFENSRSTREDLCRRLQRGAAPPPRKGEAAAALALPLEWSHAERHPLFDHVYVLRDLKPGTAPPSGRCDGLGGPSEGLGR